MVTRRGEVWWLDFGEPFGSEPGYGRPGVVVSSDRFNRSRIGTVIVSALTSTLRLGDAPGNVAVSADDSGLDRDSVVNVSQTLVVDRARLVSRLGRLHSVLMHQVDEGLRLALDL